jgi:hypothetical protein
MFARIHIMEAIKRNGDVTNIYDVSDDEWKEEVHGRS